MKKDLVRINEHLALNRAFGTGELNEILEKALDREAKFSKKVSFAPSSLGYSGACPRYWFYAFNGANFEYDNNDPLGVAHMNNGTQAGERLAGLLDKAGLLIEAEREVNTIGHPTLPPIRGYIDAVINWKGQEVIVEIKTTYDNIWNLRMNNNEVPAYQMMQLLIYMYVTDHERGFFMTENKNTGELFILPVKMTDENRAKVEEVFEWMHKVKANADEHVLLPVRPFTQASKQCKGCGIKNKCWEGFTRGSVNGTDPNPGEIELEPLVL